MSARRFPAVAVIGVAAMLAGCQLAPPTKPDANGCYPVPIPGITKLGPTGPYNTAKPAPQANSINRGRTQNARPCSGPSRRKPNQPTMGNRSRQRRGAAPGGGADQGLMSRRRHARR